MATRAEIREDVISLLGTDPQASTAEVNTLIQLKYDHVYSTFHWSRRLRDFTLSLLAERISFDSTADYEDEVLADSPIAWWRLAEPSGSTLTDSSGNARHGDYQGTPTLGAASLIAQQPSNTAVTFPGNGVSYARSPVSTVFDPGTGSMSWECWFKTSTAATSDKQLYSRHAGSTVSGVNLFLNPSMRISCGVHGVITAESPTGTVYNDNVRHHVVAVLDRDEDVLYLYVDGYLRASVNAVSIATVDLTTVNRANIGVEFPGTIDDVAVYATALSAERVLAHYQAGAVTDTVTAALGSATILSAGAPFTSEMNGAQIQIGDERQYAFLTFVDTGEITLHDGEGTAITWAGTSAAGLSWRVFKTIYALPSTCDAVLSLAGDRPLEEYDGGRTALDRDDPERASTSNHPDWWLYAGEDSSSSREIEIVPCPTQARILRGQMLRKAPTLGDSTETGLNRAYMVYGVAADALNMLHAKTGDGAYKELALFYERKHGEVGRDLKPQELERTSPPVTLQRAGRRGRGDDWRVNHLDEEP